MSGVRWGKSSGFQTAASDTTYRTGLYGADGKEITRTVETHCANCREVLLVLGVGTGPRFCSPDCAFAKRTRDNMHEVNSLADRLAGVVPEQKSVGGFGIAGVHVPVTLAGKLSPKMFKAELQQAPTPAEDLTEALVKACWSGLMTHDEARAVFNEKDAEEP